MKLWTKFRISFASTPEQKIKKEKKNRKKDEGTTKSELDIGFLAIEPLEST